MYPDRAFRHAVSGFDWERTFPATPTTFAIERNRMKCIQFHGVRDIEERYDPTKDPSKMVKLIDYPAHRATRPNLRRGPLDPREGTK